VTAEEQPGREAPTPPRFRELGLADLVTLSNTGFGMVAILAAIHHAASGEKRSLWIAFGALPLALLCDVMDGVIARKRRKSPFGGDLDSLSDVVSFGVAPAALAYSLGLNGGWDAVVLIFFVGCGVARLARYNVVADLMAGPSGKVSHYEGTPIPMSLIVVAILAYLFGTGHAPDRLVGWRLGPWLFHPLILLYALNGALMVSRLKIPKP
jgi:CDP-diacylglycerol--serine O-phosphatidyltransferase